MKERFTTETPSTRRDAQSVLSPCARCRCGELCAGVRRGLVALAVVFSVVARPSAAQTNAERILSDVDTRSHDYDLVHQRIEAWGFDWDSLAFMGRVTTTVVSRRPGSAGRK